MASTNKTSHYNLSQYSANDKPTYLVDYNGDMYNIDNGIYNAQSKADNNETSIGNLTNLETTAKNNIVNAINEVVGVNTIQTNNINTNTSNISVNATSIGTLNNLDTTNKSNLVSAINEVKSKTDSNASNIAKFGKKLWEGTFTSGSINVDGSTNYKVFVVFLGSLACFGTRSFGISGLVNYGAFSLGFAGYRVGGSADIWTIDEYNKGGSNGNSQEAITEIYGLF